MLGTVLLRVVLLVVFLVAFRVLVVDVLFLGAIFFGMPELLLADVEELGSCGLTSLELECSREAESAGVLREEAVMAGSS